MHLIARMTDRPRTMRIEIAGYGKGVAYLEENAAGTTRESSDLVMSDPIPLFARYINLGFYTPDGREHNKASIGVVSSTYDPVSEVQRWVLDIENMSEEPLRIAANLLMAAGIQSGIEQVTEVGGVIARRSLIMDRGPWSDRLVEPPFTLVQNLDGRDSIHGCEVQVEFDQSLTKETVGPICMSIETWANVVARSGFAPPETDPANAGTFPSGTYQFDSHTIASGFDYVFRVDLACFDALIAYLSGIHRDGQRISSLTIS